jgi:thiosulfate/3-mercaptopyruvate sulfurtransferase
MRDPKLQPLVETDWLHHHLDDPDLRILDCTVFLRPVEGGVRPESGRSQWEQAHIPGAGFADLLGDLSDAHTHLPIMMPPAAQFADAMASATTVGSFCMTLAEICGPPGFGGCSAPSASSGRRVEWRMEEVDPGATTDVLRRGVAPSRWPIHATCAPQPDCRLEGGTGGAE